MRKENWLVGLELGLMAPICCYVELRQQQAYVNSNTVGICHTCIWLLCEIIIFFSSIAFSIVTEVYLFIHTYTVLYECGK